MAERGDGSAGVPGEEKTYTIIRYHEVEAQGCFLPQELLEAIDRIMNGTGDRGSI